MKLKRIKQKAGAIDGTRNALILEIGKLTASKRM